MHKNTPSMMCFFMTQYMRDICCFRSGVSNKEEGNSDSEIQNATITFVNTNEQDSVYYESPNSFAVLMAESGQNMLCRITSDAREDSERMIISL